MAFRTGIKVLAGLLLAGLLMAWVLRGSDPHEIWQQFRRASVAGLILAGLLGLSHNVFRVWRWGVLLHPVRPGLPFRPMFHAVILGYLTTWTIPGRLGELVRPVLLSAREKVPLGPCMGSVLADRLLDGMAVALLFGVGTAITPLQGQAQSHAGWIRGAALVLIALVSAPLVLLILAGSLRERSERWIQSRGRALAWLWRSVLAFSQGTDALKRPGLLVRAALHTLGAWLLITVGTWVGVLACGVWISLGAMMVIMPLLALGIALPTPAGAGGYHAAMTFGLTQLFAVDEPLAIGASFLVHASSVLPVIVLGGVLLLVEGLSLPELLRAAGEVRKLGDRPTETERLP